MSAILLNDAYYAFLYSGKRTVKDIPIVGPEYLIPLKARAWLDLTERKKAGSAIDAKSMVKHRNDVFRLYRVIDPAFKTDIPKDIRDDMETFLSVMGSERVDLKNLGISQGLDSILDELRRVYFLPAAAQFVAIEIKAGKTISSSFFDGLSCTAAKTNACSRAVMSFP